MVKEAEEEKKYRALISLQCSVMLHGKYISRSLTTITEHIYSKKKMGTL